MSEKTKKPSDSLTVMTQIVMPNDTNPLHNLMGGNLLRWMDIASGIAANKHSASVVVTAAVDNVSFAKSIKLGDIVTIHAKVTRAFNTSMEVFMEVFSTDFLHQHKQKSNEAFFTFVAIDRDGKPKKVPQVIPETDEEQKLFDGAKRRRDMRLILAGKMKPEESSELRSIFLKDIIE